MKGRKLTLEEVLNLEDGTKVWVESKYNMGEILCFMYSFMGDGHCRLSEDYSLDSKYYDLRDFDDLEVYELLYERESESKPKFHPVIAIKMAQEIVNLRGLDLTDDNIRLIVEEFS